MLTKIGFIVSVNKTTLVINSERKTVHEVYELRLAIPVATSDHREEITSEQSLCVWKF